MGLTDLNKEKSNNVAVSEKKANFNPAIINRIFGFMFFPSHCQERVVSDIIDSVRYIDRRFS